MNAQVLRIALDIIMKPEAMLELLTSFMEAAIIFPMYRYMWSGENSLASAVVQTMTKHDGFYVPLLKKQGSSCIIRCIKYM